MYARPIACFERPKANIWRFYTEPRHEWKWQQLSVVGAVITESTRSYTSYDECVADAKDSGYVLEPAQTRKSFDSSRHLRTRDINTNM
jgi:hypothetical protein